MAGFISILADRCLEMVVNDHAALMDGVYKKQRYIYDFTRKYYLFGRDLLIRELALRPGERVVEIGCGTARNLIKMARLYPDAQFFGLDASAEMLATAKKSLIRTGMDHRIRLAHGMAEQLSPDMFDQHAPFDRAVFSYSLSMIPDWKQSLKMAARALNKNGQVHIVDFGDLTGLGPPVFKLLTLWLKIFHVSPRVEILEKLSLASANTVENCGALRMLPARYAFVWRGTGRMAESAAL